MEEIKKLKPEETKTVKKEEIKNGGSNVIEDEVKRKRDLTAKEIAALPKIRVMLKKTTWKNGNSKFEVITRFHKRVKISETIEENTFNLALIELNKDLDEKEVIVDVPYRAFKGINVKGNEYNRFELLISENVYLSVFFKLRDLKLLEHLDVEIEFLQDFKKDIDFEQDEF